MSSVKGTDAKVNDTDAGVRPVVPGLGEAQGQVWQGCLG
jgi:hypothetical protein